MVVVKIIDNLEVEYGLQIYENNENGETFIQQEKNCKGTEENLDDILDTNDEMIVININPTKEISKDIVKHLINEHRGETFEKNLVRKYVKDILDSQIEEIVDCVDKIMMDGYLTEDNITIKGD